MILRSGDEYRLAVHATPGAKRNHVGGEHDEALRVSVTAPADRGKANEAIIDVLAAALAIRPRQIMLQSGQTHRRKVFVISEPPIDLVERVRLLAQDV